MEGLEIHAIDGSRGLRLVGELDMQTATRLKEAFARIDGDSQTTLDVSEVTFIDSAGLHAIAEFARGENGSGPVILQGASPHMLRLFEITALAESPTLEIRVATHVG